MCLYTPVEVNTEWKYGNTVIKKDCPPGNRLKGIFLLFFWPQIEPAAPAVEAQYLNHWITGEVPGAIFSFVFFFNIFSKFSLVNPIRTRKERKLCLKNKKKDPTTLVCLICRGPVPQTR